MKDKTPTITSLEMAIDSLPVPVTLKDVEGRIVHANPNWRKFFGIEDEHINFDILENFLNDEDLAKEAHRDKETLLAGEPQVEEIWFNMGEKGRYLLEVTRSPVFDSQGHANSILAVYHDVSGFNWALEELKHNLAACVEKEQLGRQVLARLGHRLGTPLETIIEGCNQMISRELNKQQHTRLLSMREVAVDLKNHLDSIVELSTLHLGYKNIKSNQFDLDDLITRTIEAYQSIAEKKCLNLLYEGDVRIPLQLKGDEEKLRELLNILVHNAIDFTDEGVVKIRASIDQKFTTEDVTAVTISISDTGQGIDKSDQKHIFTPYFDKPHKNYGLGLAIAQTITKTLGSQLKVSSVKGRGSTFYCTLLFRNVSF
jgi:PAS domain S-box-containing protein